MTIRLLDPEEIRGNLLPLTFTRPVAALRIGIDTILEKWQAAMAPHKVVAVSCADYLAPLWPDCHDAEITVAGNLIPDEGLVKSILGLADDTALALADGTVIARRGDGKSATVTYTGANPVAVTTLPSLFMQNAEMICADFERFTLPYASAEPGEGTIVIGPRERLFIEPGATVVAATINVTAGPVYVGRGAEIAEGSCVRGPLALLEGSHINMGSKIYPGTTIGPHCKVGGEINNVIFQGYSNKAHDGFLGNAVIGEWCNLGAGCVASNLKNNYSEIRLWNYRTERFERTGLQFCGLIMADHSKAGIQTMFNTATVVGVGCNIHGAGFPRTFIPSFSFGGAAGFDRVPLNKMFDTARLVMARRGKDLTPEMQQVLTAIYNL